MSVENLNKATLLSQEYPTVFTKATKISDSFSILSKIYDNRRLFTRLCSPFFIKGNEKQTIFSDLIDAIFELKDRKMPSILVSFVDIGLYGVFTYKEYITFVSNYRMADSEKEKPFDVRQIVLSGEKQKLVIACTNMENFDKLAKYAGDCFGVKINHSQNQITVNIINNNESELIENYNKLYHYIDKKGDINCCESMQQIQLMDRHTNKYRIYAATDSLLMDSDNIYNFLRNVPDISPVCAVLSDGVCVGFQHMLDTECMCVTESNYVVYFITEVPFSGRIKIGKTSNLEKRIKALQTGNPSILAAYNVIYCPNEVLMTQLENLLHKELADKRITGEWFEFTQDYLNLYYNKFKLFYHNSVNGIDNSRKDIHIIMENTINEAIREIDESLQNPIKTDIYSMRIQRVKDWIAANPPHLKEFTNAYYSRYYFNNNSPLVTNIFGKLVREFGYDTLQSRKGRYWVKIHN